MAPWFRQCLEIPIKCTYSECIVFDWLAVKGPNASTMTLSSAPTRTPTSCCWCCITFWSRCPYRCALYFYISPNPWRRTINAVKSWATRRFDILWQSWRYSQFHVETFTNAQNNKYDERTFSRSKWWVICLCFVSEIFCSFNRWTRENLCKIHRDFIQEIIIIFQDSDQILNRHTMHL